ncbi:MAG: ATP-binding cassette domain-containing protein [Nocardioidaceae bacterium]
MGDERQREAEGQREAEVLRAEGLTRRLADGTAIVDEVTFSVSRGEVVAVVGGSGAGKSSLLRLLNRLDEPTAGRVLVEGVDQAETPPGELRRRVGMVLQTPRMFTGTVADNLRWAFRARGEDLDDATVTSLLERVQLPGYADREAGSLSGGEAQRVSLARTLANQPRVLLLDEPTSALDEDTKAEVEATLRDVLTDQDVSCLIVTHDEAQARRLATRALRMAGGRVVADGAVAEVLES